MDITYDQENQTATFCGQGTFDAKDDIKRLGVATWNNTEKAWKVKNISLSLDALKELFPTADFILTEGKTQKTNLEETSSMNSSATNFTAQSTNIPTGMSVSEFIKKVRDAIKSTFPSNIVIYGILSSVKQTPEGRIYMDIAAKENRGDIVPCVIWANASNIIKPLTNAGFKLEPDLEVMFEARVDLNSRRAGISLSVTKIIAEYTVSKLAALREITNERLKKEGLFDKNKQTVLSFLPKRLGLLTSTGGTVIHDFRSALDAANFDFELFWVDVNVQGAQAKSDIIRGLKTLCKLPNLDAVLIFRGGGSAGDLAVFNEYDVAREVCLCPLPIISAIGHQEDQSSVQDVSFLALGVPKDIGHFFAKKIADFRRSFFNNTKMIQTKSFQLFEISTQRISDFSSSLIGLSAKIILIFQERLRSWFGLKESRVIALLEKNLERVNNKHMFIEEQILNYNRRINDIFIQNGKNISSSVQSLIDKSSARLRISNELHILSNNLLTTSLSKSESIERILKEASPDVQLKRGFTLIKKQDSNNYILNPDSLNTGDKIEIEFHDKSKLAEII